LYGQRIVVISFNIYWFQVTNSEEAGGGPWFTSIHWKDVKDVNDNIGSRPLVAAQPPLEKDDDKAPRKGDVVAGVDTRCTAKAAAVKPGVLVPFAQASEAARTTYSFKAFKLTPRRNVRKTLNLI
jgi:hypothetical protein